MCVACPPFHRSDGPWGEGISAKTASSTICPSAGDSQQEGGGLLASRQPVGLAVSFVWRQMLQRPGVGKLLPSFPLSRLCISVPASLRSLGAFSTTAHYQTAGTCVQRRGRGRVDCGTRRFGAKRAGTARGAHTPSHPLRAREHARIAAMRGLFS